MSKRVVMRLTNWSQDIKNVRKFLDRAESLGAGPQSKLLYAVDENNHPIFYIILPEKAAQALEKSRTPKPLTKAQQAVQDQLRARQEAVKSGQSSGHVKPVVRNGKVILTIKKRKAA